jgi:hypothetical protein
LSSLVVIDPESFSLTIMYETKIIELFISRTNINIFLVIFLNHIDKINLKIYGDFLGYST